MYVLNLYFILTTDKTGNKAYYAFVDTREILNPIQLLFRLHTYINSSTKNMFYSCCSIVYHMYMLERFSPSRSSPPLARFHKEPHPYFCGGTTTAAPCEPTLGKDISTFLRFLRHSILVISVHNCTYN